MRKNVEIYYTLLRQPHPISENNEYLWQKWEPERAKYKNREHL